MSPQRTLIATIVVLLFLSLPSYAADAPDMMIRDHELFSLQIPTAQSSRFCVIEPQGLRETDACSSFKLDGLAVPAVNGATVLAFAMRRLTNRDVEILTIIRTEEAQSDTERLNANPTARMQSMADGVRDSLPLGTTTRASSARIVERDGVSFLRGTIEAENLPTNLRSFEHEAAINVNAEGNMYVVSLAGPQTSAQDVDNFIDAATAKVTVSKRRDISRQVGRVIGFALMAIIGLAAFLFDRRRRRRRARNERPK